MSISVATTFLETLVTCWALRDAIASGTLSKEYEEVAQDVLDNARSQMWEQYPYECEDYIDQDAEPQLHPITPFPPEVIAENLARREANKK